MAKRDWVQNKLPRKVKKDIENRNTSDKKKKKLISKAKKYYKNMQVTPGECVGIVGAQSLGEPGTQLSIPASEKVLIKTDGKIKSVEIGQFVDKIMSAKNCVKEGCADVCYLKNKNYNVLSLDKNEKLKWKNLKACSRHKNREPLLMFTLKSGRQITATKAHSFVIRKDNQITPVAGSKLKVGDRLPVVKKLPKEEEASVSLREYFSPKQYWYGSELQKATSLGPNYIKGYDTEYQVPVKIDQLRNHVYGRSVNQATDGFVYPSQIHSTETGLPEDIDLDQDFGWLIGAYLSEGSTAPYFISIANSAPNFVSTARQVADNFGFTTNEYNNAFGGHDFRINSKMLSTFIQRVCSKRARDKKVPNFAYSAPLPFVSALLQAYFDGDGNVTVERKVIRAHSASKQLLDGIALLLARFGIFARKSKEKYYALHIPYRYAPLFLDKIGLNIKHKKEKLEELAKFATAKRRRTQDYIEMHSGFGNIFYRLARKLGVPTREVDNFTKRQKIGSRTLERYIKKFKSLAEKRSVDISKDIKILEKIANSDVAWDEIVSIEKVTSDSEYLYDFSVSGLETFVTFDGVVTHNTMRTFHHVGVAELNVTMGLPRIIEIFDARKKPKTPAMHIALNKPYNKDKKKAEQFANRLREINLEQLSSSISIDLANSAIEVNLARKALKLYGMKPSDVKKICKKKVKRADISASGYKITFKFKDYDIKKLNRTKSKIKRKTVAGVKGITDVLLVKKDGEYVVQTFGTNLKKVMKLEEVDYAQTTSNNIHEVAKTLGVEASRQTIINEIVKVWERQGVDVDERHIALVADTMCMHGTIEGTTRHGIIKQKSSVLARASFEIPIRHLVAASEFGEEDQLTSVVENVMINQPIPIGTGLPDLVIEMDEDKRKKARKAIKKSGKKTGKKRKAARVSKSKKSKSKKSKAVKKKKSKKSKTKGKKSKSKSKKSKSKSSSKKKGKKSKTKSKRKKSSKKKAKKAKKKKSTKTSKKKSTKKKGKKK